MTQLHTGLGQIAQPLVVHSQAPSGASHPTRGPATPRKEPKPVRILTATDRKPIGCKTCKGRGCVGRCRF